MSDMNKEIYWSQFVDEFERKQQHVVKDNILSLMQAELLKEQNLGEVLELGCGTGLFSERLHKVSKQVLATDYSDEMIAAAQKKRGNLKNVTYQKANAFDLEFPNESFDTVFMANLIHVIGNAEQVVQESKRVLRKGGQLIITSFSITEMNFFNRMTMGIRYLKTFGKPSDASTQEKTTRESVETLLVNNGFEVTKSLLLGNKSKAFYSRSIKN